MFRKYLYFYHSVSLSFRFFSKGNNVLFTSAQSVLKYNCKAKTTRTHTKSVHNFPRFYFNAATDANNLTCFIMNRFLKTKRKRTKTNRFLLLRTKNTLKKYKKSRWAPNARRPPVTDRHQKRLPAWHPPITAHDTFESLRQTPEENKWTRRSTCPSSLRCVNDVDNK